jgi:hypothetical protein
MEQVEERREVAQEILSRKKRLKEKKSVFS